MRGRFGVLAAVLVLAGFWANGALASVPKVIVVEEFAATW